MFKAGDRVRCLTTCEPMLVNVGKIYTVLGNCGKLVNVIGNTGLRVGMFARRFELVADEPFNISTATDQELADEYRRLLADRIPVKDALISRGYEFTTVKGRSIKFFDDVSISKTETSKIVL